MHFSLIVTIVFLWDLFLGTELLRYGVCTSSTPLDNVEVHSKVVVTIVTPTSIYDIICCFTSLPTAETIAANLMDME